MKNFILTIAKFFFSIKNHNCRHTNALLHSNEGYCPDCGQYLCKHYYVIRCKCCEVKRSATKMYFGHFGKIVPTQKFCTNCGGSEYYIEKQEKLNFTDIHYAIECKEEVAFDTICPSKTKIWVESTKETTFYEKPPLRLIRKNA